MASSPLQAPTAAAGQHQSRLYDMQKKFQQRHLATLAAVKGAAATSTSSTTSSTATTDAVGHDPPIAPARRFGGAGVIVPQQKCRTPRAGSGKSGSEGTADGARDSAAIVQVDVKGKQKSRPIGRINSKTTTTAKKPQQAVAVNSNGRAVKKPTIVPQDDAYDSMGVTPNRLLLPPVVQPTVINALAAGSSTASAVASVGAAATAAAGVQRPVIRAAKIPGPGILRPLQQQQQQPKPVAPSRQRSAATTRHPVATQHRGPSARPQPNAIKQQMSADRGPPAKGMARCPLCARDFASDRLPKHEEVCRRTREKDRKRKVFDTSRKRLETVAAEAGVDVSSLKKKGQKEDERAAGKLQKKKDAWRRKHEQLVRNVRAARAVQRHLAAGGNIRDLPPELDNAGAAEPDEIDSDLVKCPHCNRTFNEASAERHIPLCAERQRNAAARLQNKKR